MYSTSSFTPPHHHLSLWIQLTLGAGGYQLGWVEPETSATILEATQNLLGMY